MSNLTYLVTEGQRLVEDAREHRIAEFGTRSEAWARKVELALADNPIALVRFKQAQSITTPTPGITYGTINDFFLLRGRLAVLTEIATEHQRLKRDEVLVLKPSLWGVGLDLKAAWRRWRKGGQ
jgi:hypothetical protein